jgi:hypothetical protein
MEIRRIDSLLEDKLEKAWEVRKQNFPPFIHFDYPEQTKSISLTGKECGLDCAHCGGHYLKQMGSLNKFMEKEYDEFSSCLISGGCNSQGKVDFSHCSDDLKNISSNKKINMHVGLLNEKEIIEVSEIADVVSFDFIADQESINEVYGLEKSVDDYINIYSKLRERVKVLPHICIGLKGGEIEGEYKTLEILKELGVDGLVFIVFIPTSGTKYSDRNPPVLEEVIELLAYARINFPQIPIHLGCMRPKGRYRAELDYYAVKSGINKIVVPTSYGVKRAEELDLEINYGEECCVL